MGSSQSSRKITIANDEDDVNVIRISDSVVKRLSQSATDASKSSSSAALTPAHSAQSSPSIVTAAAAAVARPAVQAEMLPDAYHPHFTISALEMQQQKERELAEQEAYWQRRLQNLEKTHEKINRAIDDEYKKALTIFDDSRVIKVQDSVRPCNENRQKVLKCYQDNPRETLRCADLVEQFSNCVDQRRAQLMRCN